VNNLGFLARYDNVNKKGSFMKKTLAVILLTMGCGSVTASTIKVDVDNTCVFDHKVPKKPIAFNKYYTLDAYNDTLEDYNKGLSAYKKCVGKVINKLNVEIDKLERFGREAVQEAEKFDYKEYIEEKKKP
jgi:hypothetical protein